MLTWSISTYWYTQSPDLKWVWHYLYGVQRQWAKFWVWVLTLQVWYSYSLCLQCTQTHTTAVTLHVFYPIHTKWLTILILMTLYSHFTLCTHTHNMTNFPCTQTHDTALTLQVCYSQNDSFTSTHTHDKVLTLQVWSSYSHLALLMMLYSTRLILA